MNNFKAEEEIVEVSMTEIDHAEGSELAGACAAATACLQATATWLDK